MTLSRETNYNGGDDYVRAISKGVRKMLPESGDILTYLDKLTDRSGHGFDGDCFDEECLKAKLILRSPEWEKLVIAAEDNKYFNGQIGFLFEISGIDKQFKMLVLISGMQLRIRSTEVFLKNTLTFFRRFLVNLQLQERMINTLV